MNILIVDDEAVIREGIQRTLKRAFPECRPRLAGCPEEAARVLGEQSIDIVLTDILMPGMTGLELMQLFRRRFPRIKWVVISAHSEFAYAQEAVRLGAREYLLKPIGKDRLADVVRMLAGELREETELSRETEELRVNLRYLREAVFQRWASGLDIGRYDIRSLMEGYPRFHLVMVKMESDRKVHLEHYMIENVLTELIEQQGRGFVVSFDSRSLLGLAALDEAGSFEALLGSLRSHLKLYLKVPYQVLHSPGLQDISIVADEVRRMRESSAGQAYEPCDGGGDRAVETAVQYIRANYQSELSLEKTAALVFLNPVYFSQLFKQKTGSGFKEFITSLRLQRARHLLEQSQLKVAEIAERVGYQDMRHFTQMFRRKFLMTPTEYRQQLQVSGGQASAETAAREPGG